MTMPITWQTVGIVANIAQLTGVDLFNLIVLICEAANNARMHKSQCLLFAQWLTMVNNVLRPVINAEWIKIRENQMILERLEGALGRARDLVDSCGKRSYPYLFVTRCGVSKRLNNSRAEIESILPLFQIAATNSLYAFISEPQNPVSMRIRGNAYHNAANNMHDNSHLESVPTANNVLVGAPAAPFRASRGQATDRKSIVEQDRRRKIAKNLQSLHNLVPNATKEAATERFKQLLDEATEDTKYKDFAKKCRNDSRFKDLDPKRRKLLFNERVNTRRKGEEKENKARFKDLLRERGDINLNSRFSQVEDSLRNDPIFKAVKKGDRTTLFNELVAEMGATQQDIESGATERNETEVEISLAAYMPNWLRRMVDSLPKILKCKPTCTRDVSQSAHDN